MDEIEQFVKYYGEEEGKYEAGGETFATLKRATQFKRLFIRECGVTMEYTYECCKDGDVVWTMDPKQIYRQESVRRDTKLSDWVERIYDETEEFLDDAGDNKCSLMISSSRMCNSNLAILRTGEQK